ncbi:MAG: GDSL family lipase [Proteobacteria bacterium]|nr:GDSL family lipase [Pseudomonadota bacterium]
MGKYRHLLLVGDSMIEFFDWQGRFPELKVDNLGRAGESVEELQLRAENIVRRFAPPDLVLIMIGTNNVAMENFAFHASYEGILSTFKKAWTDADLLVNSLLPMELGYLAPDTVERVNGRLKELAERNGADYLDVWSAMAGKEGRALAGMLEDEVHLTREGYRIWSGALESYLNRK